MKNMVYFVKEEELECEKKWLKSLAIYPSFSKELTYKINPNNHFEWFTIYNIGLVADPDTEIAINLRHSLDRIKMCKTRGK